MTQCPVDQPISSLALADIPAFEFCSCTVQSRGSFDGLEPDSRLREFFGALRLGYASHLGRQGQNFIFLSLTISSISVAPLGHFVITNSEKRVVGRRDQGYGCRRREVSEGSTVRESVTRQIPN